MVNKKYSFNDTWRDALIEVVNKFINDESNLSDITKKELQNHLFVEIRTYFDNAVRECCKRIMALNESKTALLEAENKSVSEFLYHNPPKGGFPDSRIRIGVAFEVGGTYEDWGYLVEYDGKRIAAGRTLRDTIDKARKIIREDFDKDTEVKKCNCGNEGIMTRSDTGEWLCMNCFVKV